jgi:hypothetical protein
MARIRLLVSVAGDGVEGDAGQEIDLPGAQAKVWADGVRAVMVRSEKPETPEAAAADPEKAARTRTRRAPTGRG